MNKLIISICGTLFLIGCGGSSNSSVSNTTNKDTPANESSSGQTTQAPSNDTSPAGNNSTEQAANTSPDDESSPNTANNDEAPTTSNPCSFDKQAVINLINQERAKARSCGSTAYAAAGAVTWNDKLQQAAQKHSYDMATNNFHDHTGTDGTQVSSRIEQAGYHWQAVAENLAAGHTAQSAINGWFFQSAGHCENMRNNSYSEIGFACSYNPNSTYKTYWTLTLASPR